MKRVPFGKIKRYERFVVDGINYKKIPVVHEGKGYFNARRISTNELINFRDSGLVEVANERNIC